MRQLTSLDSQFLALETPRQSGHVASVAILDTSTTPSGTLTLADIQALITERLPLLPPLRWRLQEVPLGLDYPYWVDDIDFDLDFHVASWGCEPWQRRATRRAGCADRLAPAGPLQAAVGLYLITPGLRAHRDAHEDPQPRYRRDGGAEIMACCWISRPSRARIDVPRAGGDNELAPGALGMLARACRRRALPLAGPARAALDASEPRGDATAARPPPPRSAGSPTRAAGADPRRGAVRAARAARRRRRASGARVCAPALAFASSRSMTSRPSRTPTA